MTRRVAIKLIVQVPDNVSSATARMEVEERVGRLRTHMLNLDEIKVVSISAQKGEKK